jgi:hypothetical protein
MSLYASLNMKYVDYVDENSKDLNVIYEQLKFPKVVRLLKSKGYKYIHSGSWWGPTRWNENADMNINLLPYNLDEFSNKLLATTLLHPILLNVNDFHKSQRKRINYKFLKLQEVPDIEGPKFVFIHMLFPHPPFVLNDKCEPLTKEEKDIEYNKQYINQLICTNKKIKSLIDTILSKSKVPPIIILQSDEGPIPIEYDCCGKSWFTGDKDFFILHSRILNAYYLPNSNNVSLYPSISPVNSFRLIFNQYFGTNFKLLKDTCYLSDWPERPYKFRDITHIVDYDATTRSV